MWLDASPHIIEPIPYWKNSLPRKIHPLQGVNTPFPMITVYASPIRKMIVETKLQKENHE